MDISKAIVIAEDLCKQISLERHAVYAGEFNGGHLFRLSFVHGGHHGNPIFIVVHPDETYEIIDSRDEQHIFAWKAANAFSESQKGD